MSTPTGKPPADSRLLTVSACAELLGLPYGTIRTLVLRGTLPRVEIPGLRKLMVDRRDLERALAAWKANGR